MKKMIITVLALSLLFLFAGCGKDDKSGELTGAGDETEVGITTELETQETESEFTETPASLPDEILTEPDSSHTVAQDVESLINRISTTAANIIGKTTKAVTSAAGTNPSAQDETSADTTTSTTIPETTTEAQTTVRSGRKFSFSTTDMRGNSVTLDNYSDAKLIMINIWEPWCGPCVREMPDLQKLYDNYKSKGFLILGVASSPAEDVNSVVSDFGITYPILARSDHFNAFATGSVPTTVFLDSEGYVLTPEPFVGSRSYEAWEDITIELLDAVS
jgi:thiol-disulfide isomerase/thioredoxin